jgi:hypothetical protein
MKGQIMISRLVSLLIGLGMILLIAPAAVIAQEAPSQEQQKAQAALREKAISLLEQVISEAQTLKLPENRLRVQFYAGDLLWERDEARARSLFSQAAAGITEMIQSLDSSDRRYVELLQAPLQLRQELLMTIARRNPKLAYDLLLATRPPVPPNTPNAGQQTMESNLEMNLLAQIASSDPRLALQNAEAALEKGQFPGSLARLLAQLQPQDKEAAAKLKEKLLKRLRAETLLANQSASSLALSLLRPGPRPPETPPDRAPAAANPNNPNQALDEASYRELLEVVTTVALNAVPRGAVSPGTPGSAQVAQNNTRNLLMGLQSLLPQIDKYLPARSQAVRQKFTELGIKPTPRLEGELANLMRQGSADALLQAAPKAPPEMQSMLYRQAAFKAISEGNTERARQIATEHLDPKQREVVFQELERQRTLQATLAGKMEDARQQLARLRTDAERVNWLTQVAAAAMQKKDAKLALQFLDEARSLVNRRAENYQQFDLQLRVVRAYVSVDAARALEVLAPGIEQLNELLSATAALSGFELRVFKDGEMLLQGGGQLNNLVTRCGQELATLARSDFERAQTAADRFQRTESRLIARLAIVRGLLGARTTSEMPMVISPGVVPEPILR